MRRFGLAIFLGLLAVILGIGLGIGGRSFLRAVEGPTPVVTPPEPALPEIPMPTVSPIQGVLATLPPVEKGKLIQPPPARSSKLLYITYEMSERGGSHYHIFDLQKNEEIELSFPPEQYVASLELTLRASPTGERMVYSVFFDLFALDPVVGNPAAKEMGSIWIINPDGSDRRHLVGSDGLYFPANPIWSPEGKEIAFLRFPDPRAVEQGKVKAEQAELWIMGADGSQQRKVADLPYGIDHIFGANPSMQWLLNDYIYLITGIARKGDWLQINPRTGEVTRLMENVGPWEIQISPDTQWMVTVGDISDATIQALGRKALHLHAVPAWDPTGARVAFINLPPYTFQETGVWIIDLESGKQTRLTSLDVETAARCDRLSWSPDGTMLLCDAFEGLYVVWIEQDASQMVVRNPLVHISAAGTKFIGWVPVSTLRDQP